MPDTTETFDLDAVPPPMPLEPFPFTWGGQSFTLDHLQGLDAWALTEATEGGDTRAMTGSLRVALGDQYEQFRALGLPQYKVRPLWKAWIAHCRPPAEDDPQDTTA
jgi:hypothetical protein